jgi:hypothetical protein
MIASLFCIDLGPVQESKPAAVASRLRFYGKNEAQHPLTIKKCAKRHSQSRDRTDHKNQRDLLWDLTEERSQSRKVEPIADRAGTEKGQQGLTTHEQISLN